MVQTTLKRSGMDHTAFNLQRTPCLPLPRKRSSDGASTECGSKHLIDNTCDQVFSCQTIFMLLTFPAFPISWPLLDFKTYLFLFRRSLRQLHSWFDGRVAWRHGAHFVEIRPVCPVSRCSRRRSYCLPAMLQTNGTSQISHCADWRLLAPQLLWDRSLHSS